MVVGDKCRTWTARRNWTPQAILYLKGARKTLQSKLNTVEFPGFEPFCQQHVDVLQKDTAQCCGAPAERKGTRRIEVEEIQTIPRMNQSSF
ncbi:hypothetical protein EYF80_007780 [Liparis tanakae]|uniref:Uncharacterized protein n=1 Tax=Liparis tanakae TaxID=230148 RepID=A0A4Z2IX64_9TELE|nr:hypothetical protein EYF80_007780 [Liparis tanakae]